VLMRDVFLRRQPILTRRLDVWGYQVSASHPSFVQLPPALRGSATHPDLSEAEARLLFDALAEVGLPTLVGHSIALIELSPAAALAAQDFLAGLATPDRLIPLLTLEPPPDRQLLLDAIAALRSHGFRVGTAGVPSDEVLQAVTRTIDLVAVEYSRANTRLDTLASHLRAGRALLLVTGIEDYQALDRCREQRVTLFAGTFLALPRPVRALRAPTSRALLLLLARLQDPEVEFSELEALISLDVGLTYRLLRLVNTVWLGRRRIESVRQALLVLGTRLVSAWVTLLLMADIPDKPQELLTLAIVRARMAELVAAARGRTSRESAFLVGLLSVLDALLDQPMSDLVAALPLADELSAALLHREGELGLVLDIVLAYERGDWLRLPASGLRPSLLSSAYVDALAFAREIESALAA